MRTFAYFSVTVQGNNSTTTVTATTGAVGVVNVTSEISELTLTVTADDMAQPTLATNYYAIKESELGNSQNGGKWANAEQQHVISKATLQDGSANETVKCNTSVQVTLAGAMADELQAGDAFISLDGFGLAAGNKNVDLYTIAQEGAKTKTFQSEETGITLTSSDNSKELKADLYLVNKTEPQNDLAGKTLTVTIKPSATCEIQKAED